MQARHGVWYGERSDRNYHSHIPAHERQSITWGELWAVLYALLQRWPVE